MDENIDLTNILKDCPKGFKLYSLVHGEVKFQKIELGIKYPIVVKLKNNIIERYDSYGKLLYNYDGECILFQSNTQRDWSKFTAPWYKKEKFDPKTLQPFDKVLVRDKEDGDWICSFFSHITDFYIYFPYSTVGTSYKYCIPYNEDTKHLVGTTDEAPEFYHYWEE